MLINLTKKYQFSLGLTLNGGPIELLNKIKILGVTVSSELDWDENTIIIIKKVHQRMQLLIPVWSFGRGSIPEIIHLWKCYCLSVLEQSFVETWKP